MERISFRIDADLKRRLEAEAKATGVSPSDLVREALREHLRSREADESCYDLAQRLGIIGSAKGLPPSLSANPAHMEGFGRVGRTFSDFS